MGAWALLLLHVSSRQWKCDATKRRVRSKASTIRLENRALEPARRSEDIFEYYFLPASSLPSANTFPWNFWYATTFYAEKGVYADDVEPAEPATIVKHHPASTSSPIAVQVLSASNLGSRSGPDNQSL